MLQTIFALFILVFISILAFTQCSGREPLTRGQVRDRQAAHEVIGCAGQYLPRAGSQAERRDIWTMCLDTVSETRFRDRATLAREVNRIQAIDIFAPQD